MIWDVTRRIGGGIATKVDLLRLAAKRSCILDDEARECIKLTLDGVIECKRYRDNIAHSVPYDIDKGICSNVQKGADLDQTLVTMDALTGLYYRLRLLLVEMKEIDLLYRLADEENARAVYRNESFDPLS